MLRHMKEVPFRLLCNSRLNKVLCLYVATLLDLPLGLNGKPILITETVKTEENPCQYVWFSIHRVGFRGNYVLLNKNRFIIFCTRAEGSGEGQSSHFGEKK